MHLLVCKDLVVFEPVELFLWVFLQNLQFSIDAKLQPDELLYSIDLFVHPVQVILQFSLKDTLFMLVFLFFYRLDLFFVYVNTIVNFLLSFEVEVDWGT